MTNWHASEVKLIKLLKNIPIEHISINGQTLNPTTKSSAPSKKQWQNIPISQITCDSRHIRQGCLFIAIAGETTDGHDFLKKACQGASALVIQTSKQKHVPQGFQGPVIEVHNTRWAFSQIASAFFNHPAKNIKCIGVTGTNGKTTSVYILETLLKGLGQKVGVFSTIDHHVGQQKWPAHLTTPSPIHLHQRILQISPLVDHLVMEVSSHALCQYRVDALKFSATLWTHLTHDHLDYHGTMDQYFQTKQRLFSKDLMQKNGVCAVNTDDPYGRKLLKTAYGQIITYGQNTDADLQITKGHSSFEGLQVDLRYKGKHYQASLKLIGQHNAINFTGCVALLIAMGYDIKNILKFSDRITAVPGRLELVTKTPFYGFVDYAHTSDALEQTLKNLRALSHQNKLITVFGCGGLRDKQKRPVMAHIAEKYSDIVIMTSDNPRNEDPFLILKDMEKGLKNPTSKQTLFSIVDRKQAILQGVRLAKKGDILLIAGRGHEEYQIIKNQRYPFSDREELLKTLE